ncbi:MAG TPA: ABC transporter substrate-binding protein [Acidimicrobiales bacterium]|nr:ABC transporter substrate-binding protein [Acidimicrobiales bacterium]
MRRLLAMAAALLMGISAAACSAEGSDETAGASRLEVFVPYRGVEADNFKASLRAFEDETGIEVRVIGSADFASELQRRVNDARPPDVAIVPQPGVVAELASVGGIEAPVDRSVADAVDEFIVPSAHDFALVDGEVVGVPYRLTVKSLVWYSPEQFDEMGWSVPSTLAELSDLTLDIASTGVSPWCLGIEAGLSTGWVVTDWIEDVLLRVAGPEVYDRWVAGDVDFVDDELVATFEYLQALLLVQGHVLGNASGIVRTPVEDAVLPLVEEVPRCAMHRNGTVTANWLPDGTVLGPSGDLDVFVLPPLDEGGDVPILTGVDTAVVMTDDPRADDLLAYLASPSGAAAWVSAGGFIGAHGTLDDYSTDFDTRIAALLEDGATVRVDGSDQMVTEFGEGTFWEIATQWIAGLVPTPRALQQLDEARKVAVEAAVDS